MPGHNSVSPATVPSSVGAQGTVGTDRPSCCLAPGSTLPPSIYGPWVLSWSNSFCVYHSFPVIVMQTSSKRHSTPWVHQQKRTGRYVIDLEHELDHLLTIRAIRLCLTTISLEITPKRSGRNMFRLSAKTDKT